MKIQKFNCKIVVEFGKRMFFWDEQRDELYRVYCFKTKRLIVIMGSPSENTKV